MLKQINLLVMPTDQCNMRCKYCFHGDSGYSNIIMNITTFKKLINCVSANWKDIQIVWHGGEPLSVPLEFYEEAYSYCQSVNSNFSFSLQTNASLLTQKYVDFFKSTKTKIGISYDGLTNEEVRGNTKKIINAIKLLQENGIMPGAIMVVTQKNVNNLIAEYCHFKDLELSWKLNPLFLDGAAKNNLELSLNEREYSENLYKLAKVWIYDTSCNINVQTITDIISLILMNKSRICTYNSCVGKWFCVNYEGNIYPCDRLYRSEYKLANIHDISDFNQVYDTVPFQQLLSKAILRRNFCKSTCDIYEMCYGGCNASTLLGGDLSLTNTNICTIHRYIVKKIKSLIEISAKCPTDMLNPKFIDLLSKANKSK